MKFSAKSALVAMSLVAASMAPMAYAESTPAMLEMVNPYADFAAVHAAVTHDFEALGIVVDGNIDMLSLQNLMDIETVLKGQGDDATKAISIQDIVNKAGLGQK